MHDIRAIREESDVFDRNWARRGLEPQAKELLQIDERRRALQTELQQMQQRRNEASKEIGQIKAKKGDAQALMDEVASLKSRMTELEQKEATLAESLSQHLAVLPNLLDDDVPDGPDESGNKEIRKSGTPPRRNDNPDHVAIGEKLGMMDFETAAKMSGARFVLMHSGLARLERALAQFMLDTHTQEHGYTEVSPPLMVKSQAMYGTGQLPKFAHDLFECMGEYRQLELLYAHKNAVLEIRQDYYNKIKEVYSMLSQEMHAQRGRLDVAWMSPVFKKFSEFFVSDQEAFVDISKEFQEISEEFFRMEKERLGRSWLIPTAEVSLTNMVADMILDEEVLPLRFTAFTPCFRSEAGAAGKDTKGMIRQHQFYKVEMVSVTHPEKSNEEHERMTQCAETVLKKLGLAYRTMILCGGDTGFGARRTYDIEVWLPGQGRYREISSCSNCGDFQARRMKGRFRAKGEKDTRFVHTLNGSGVAVGRALIAVLENYYDPVSATVAIPDVLKPYMGGLDRLEARANNKGPLLVASG